MSLGNGWETHIKKKFLKNNRDTDLGQRNDKRKNRLEGRDRDNEEQ